MLAHSHGRHVRLRVERVVADHALQVDVDQIPLVPVPPEAFALPTMGCRSYLTSGLARLGQREVMFVLAHDVNAAATVHEASIIGVMRTLYDLARAGRIVCAGDLTFFGDHAPFGRPRCRLAYIDPIGGAGPEIPAHALLAIYLHPDECAAAMDGGVYRVLAWLAHAYRLFPNPKFSELARASAVPVGLQASRQGALPQVYAASGARVLLQDRTLRLEVDAGTCEVMDQFDSMSTQGPGSCVLGGRAQQADARFPWLADTSSLHGVSAFGATGSVIEEFVLLAGGQDSNGIFPLEDGFVLTTTDDDCARPSARNRMWKSPSVMAGTSSSTAFACCFAAALRRPGPPRAGVAAARSEPATRTRSG